MNDFLPVPTGAAMLRLMSRSMTVTLWRRTLVPQDHILVSSNARRHTTSNANRSIRISRLHASQKSNEILNVILENDTRVDSDASTKVSWTSLTFTRAFFDTSLRVLPRFLQVALSSLGCHTERLSQGSDVIRGHCFRLTRRASLVSSS